MKCSQQWHTCQYQSQFTLSVPQSEGYKSIQCSCKGLPHTGPTSDLPINDIHLTI